MSEMIQYIAIRGDLLKTMEWPIGAVIAQACHASTAAIHLFYNDKNTQAYLADLDAMHKVVLEIPDENILNTLSLKLKAEDIHHKLWIEQPENIPTCLATKPYPKNKVQSYFKKYKLLKL
ncbi:putative peptidyl-tRNA hydrolase PTRHD1 [Calliopsis andreniformis]|uniref:putative peptidyl-tRNA hydrolase PTRHD1 n=1 Tax=Calliopsis andreniformis TaxID=337506 RepID=UPI003FCCD882